MTSLIIVAMLLTQNPTADIARYNPPNYYPDSTCLDCIYSLMPVPKDFPDFLPIADFRLPQDINEEYNLRAFLIKEYFLDLCQMGIHSWSPCVDGRTACLFCKQYSK